MSKFKNKQTPNDTKQIFNIIDTPAHQYPAKFSKANFSVQRFALRSTKYSISVRGPKIWNEFLTNEEKSIHSHGLFLAKIKSLLLYTENERVFLKLELSAGTDVLGCFKRSWLGHDLVKTTWSRLRDDFASCIAVFANFSK